MNIVQVKKEFTLTDFYLEFETNGILAFDGTDIMHDLYFQRLSELDKVFPTGELIGDDTHLEYVDCPNDPPMLEKLRLRLLSRGIPVQLNSLKHHFYEYRTNEDVLKWHNDNGSKFKDHNITINCFLDDVKPETGGRFDVCRYSDDINRMTHDSPDMWSIYPKKYTIVIFNQSREFLHKATHTTHLRRMVSYAGKA